MILMHDLTKRYGKNTVLNHITANFYPGQIYGLVGANGCGKTTLMRCICGFSQPTTGYVVVNDCLIGNKAALKRNPDLKKAANPPYKTMADFSPSTGVIIESPGFLPNETGLRNLMLLADMSGKVDKATARRAMSRWDSDLTRKSRLESIRLDNGSAWDLRKPLWKIRMS